LPSTRRRRRRRDRVVVAANLPQHGLLCYRGAASTAAAAAARPALLPRTACLLQGGSYGWPTPCSPPACRRRVPGDGGSRAVLNVRHGGALSRLKQGQRRALRMEDAWPVSRPSPLSASSATTRWRCQRRAEEVPAEEACRVAECMMEVEVHVRPPPARLILHAPPSLPRSIDAAFHTALASIVSNTPF
jgi:hypothetical protein